jgi:hypothetical protein
MATFNNGESGLNVRTKINNVLQHMDGTSGALVVNESGADVDFRVESYTNANALFVDGATGNVGIGTGGPSAKLDVNGGDIYVRGTLPIIRLYDTDTGAYAEILNNGQTLSLRADENNLGGSSFIDFRVDGAERLRIDSSGNVLVGTTSLPGSSSAGCAIRGTSEDILKSTSVTTSKNQVVFYNPNGAVGSITTSGSATAYNTSSDYRLKEDVQPMVGAAERVLALNPVNFAWKVDGSRVDGFLAHEAQEVVPHAVTGEKDGEEMQSIDHSKLVPLLTAALQDALRRITILESQR